MIYIFERMLTMSKRKRFRKEVIVAAVLGIVAIVMVIAVLATITKINKKKGDSGNKPVSGIIEGQSTKAPATSDSDAVKEPSSGLNESTSAKETSATDDGTSARPSEPQSTTPPATTPAPTPAPTPAAPSNGKWDLSTLSTTPTPFGNNPDSVIDCKIPTGVFWYTTKWGQYNVDFISDIGKRWKEGTCDEKIIYLTMDCGFDSPYYSKILDILKEKNVKATFFVTSMFYDARPDLIKRMLDEGHAIGSHSINHLDMPTLSVEKQEEEIMDVVNKLKKDHNYECKLFRFPSGSFSDQSLALVSNLGLKSLFWSYAYNDYSSVQPDVQSSYEKAVKYVHPGAIYLLHASSSTNCAFLGDWIDAVRNLGYEFGGVYPV